MKIKVNGIECNYHKHRGEGVPMLTYEGALILAGKSGRPCSVSYTTPEGSDFTLRKGGKIVVEDGLILDVRETGGA